jgi:hypothetical protein
VNVLDDRTTTFFQAKPGEQLTSAIGVWIKGFAFVGSSTTGTTGTSSTGAILVLNRFGQQIGQIKSPKLTSAPSAVAVNGQGDSTQLFVADPTAGTVLRIDLSIPDGRPVVQDIVQVASGYASGTNASGSPTGLSGLAYDSRKGVLYVASSASGTLYAVTGAATMRNGTGTGTPLATQAGLVADPAALAIEPGGDLLVSTAETSLTSTSSTSSQLTELTPQGSLVDQITLSTGTPSAALALKALQGTTILGTVNDTTGAVELWQTAKRKS